MYDRRIIVCSFPLTSRGEFPNIQHKKRSGTAGVVPLRMILVCVHTRRLVNPLRIAAPDIRRPPDTFFASDDAPTGNAPQHSVQLPQICGLPGRVRHEPQWHQASEHPGIPADAGVELSIMHSKKLTGSEPVSFLFANDFCGLGFRPF